MDRPDCYGKYPKGRANVGVKCITCPSAQDCKKIEPKRGRPAKAKAEPALDLETKTDEVEKDDE